ncbi:MAG: malate dehydrogenase [Archaeoglobales archaeon]|nr:malate dehydrogenase [Archaeoglobales archaeon]
MKIGFVGAGKVGSATAFTCILKMDVDEIVLVDVAKELAEGEAMDLSHAAAAVDKYPEIVGTDEYSALKNCDVIVVTAGIGRKPGMTRLDLAEKNAVVVKEIAEKISKIDSKVIVVTNPVDIMTYIMWKESRKDRKDVFGMGNVLDSARLKERLRAAKIKNTERVWMIGEHGDTMFVAKSLTNLNEEVNWEAIEDEVRKTAAKVIEKKKATIYGPAVSVYRMVRAVVEDTKEIMPASYVFEGEFGIKNVAVGIPVVIGRDGAKIADLELSEEEKVKLKKSAEVLRSWLNKLGY